MTINRYEKGYIPSKSQSDYLKLLLKDEKEFFNKVMEAFGEKRINEKTFSKIKSKIKNDKNMVNNNYELGS